MAWVIEGLLVLHTCFWWNGTIVPTEYAPACKVSDTGTRDQLEDKCKGPSKSLSVLGAAKYVTPRDLLELSPCPANIKPSATQQTNHCQYGRAQAKKCNVIQKNRRAAAVSVNMEESMPTTIQPACCGCSSQNAWLHVGFKAKGQDSLNQCSGNNRKRLIQPTRKQKYFGCATAARDWDMSSPHAG